METIIPISTAKKIQNDFDRLDYTCAKYKDDDKNKYTRFIAEKYLQYGDYEANQYYDCWKVLNISSGIWSIIEQAYIDGVGQPITEEEIEVPELLKNYVSTGKMVIETIIDGNEKEVEVVPSQEFQIVDEIPRRITYFQNRDDNYLFLKSYYEGQNTNQLFLLKPDSEYMGTEVPLDTLEETRKYDDIENTGISGELSIEWKEDSCSVFEKVESLVFAIERKLVAVDTELIHFVKTKTIVKGSDLSLDDVEKDTIVLGEPDANIEILKYTNALIKESWEVIKEQLALISGITKVPLDQFGIENTSAIGAEAQKSKKSGYIKRVQSLQEMIEELYEEMGEANGQGVEMRWESILVEDKMALLEELDKALSLGLITQTTAIRQYNDVTQDEAIEILNLINDGKEDTTETSTGDDDDDTKEADNVQQDT